MINYSKIIRFSVFSLLFAGIGLLFNCCNWTCPGYPTYQLTDKDKEWVCYKEGQIIKFVSNLGNVREYKVTGLTDHMIAVKEQPRSHTAITFKSCTTMKYQEVYCQITNTSNANDYYFWRLICTTRDNKIPYTHMYFDGYYAGGGLPDIGYINENINNFKDGEKLAADTTVTFYKNMVVNGKNYVNVFKIPNGTVGYYHYYTREYGIIQFELKQNNEVFSLVN
jgi:hypothetical protein